MQPRNKEVKCGETCDCFSAEQGSKKNQDKKDYFTTSDITPKVTTPHVDRIS